jgi:hypothetical protein
MSNSRSTAIPKMHWMIIGGMGIGALFTVTLPIAMWRVSQTPKFSAQAFTSLDCAGQQPPQRTVTTSEQCASTVVAPLSAQK